MTDIYEENWTEEETGVQYRRFFFPHGHRATDGKGNTWVSVYFSEEFRTWCTERGISRAYLVESFPRFAWIDIPTDNPVAMELKLTWS